MTKASDEQVIDWIALAIGQDVEWRQMARALVLQSRRLEVIEQEERMMTGQETVAAPVPDITLLRDQVIGVITAAPGWTLRDATRIVDDLLEEHEEAIRAEFADADVE